MGILASDLKSSNSKTSSKLPKPCIQANQTIALPNEDDFERMAKLSSTPHTGRAFQVKEKHSQYQKVHTVLYRWSRTRTPARWTLSTDRQWVHLQLLLPGVRKSLLHLLRARSPQLWRLQGSITGAAAPAEVTPCTQRPPMGTRATGATLNIRYLQCYSPTFTISTMLSRRRPQCRGRGDCRGTQPLPPSLAHLDTCLQQAMQPVDTWGTRAAM